MATAALLSSPSAAGGDPPTSLMTSPASPSISSRLEAAADLIRNLDAALSGMTAAATSAAEDAARARRNARVAGEVARRYGGVPSGRGGSGKKKKKGGGDNGGMASHDELLERKRERRAAARMAAEARQRREHPLLPSPRRTPRSTRGGMGVFWGGGSPPAPVVVSSNAAAEEGKGVIASAGEGKGVIGGAPRSASKVKIKVETGPETITATLATGSAKSQKIFFESTPLGNTEVVTNQNQNTIIVDSIPEVRTEGSRDTNFTEFESAMDDQNGDGDGVKYDDADGYADDGYLQQPADRHPAVEEKQPQVQPTEQEAMEGAPPAGGYYAQQNSYQNHEQQQQQHYQLNQGGNDSMYYDQSQQWHYDQPHQQQPYSNPPSEQQWQHSQQQPAPMISPSLAAATESDEAQNAAPEPSPKHSAPPTPPRSQPTSTNRIEASHAEDVLALSLELERVRSQLTSTTAQLSQATTQVGYLRSQNDHLSSELTNLHSEFESANERSSAELATAREQLEGERERSKAAEEDAALALELAKEAQQAKEECEMWLSRSLEEIDLWRGRVGALEGRLKEREEEMDRARSKEWEAVAAVAATGTDATPEEEAEEEPKKVRFKEDCPPSPVVSEDGGLEEDAANATPPAPPPPPPAWSTPQGSKSDGRAAAADDGISGVNSGVFSPDDDASGGTPDAGTPSKSNLVASGRAYLQRASPSPRKNGMTPHPRAQATDLLKKSAETRRLLRERLTPGYSGGVPHRPPGGGAAPTGRMPWTDNALGERSSDTFASRQGAACRAIGRTIRESGARLRLDGKWWEGADDASDPAVIEGVAQLESMVRGYCGGVEGTIGEQREKISELLAFCDHLEREVMLERE